MNLGEMPDLKNGSHFILEKIMRVESFRNTNLDIVYFLSDDFW